MGQYYKFMNIDKKQVCQRNWHSIKLTEHSYLGNNYCDDILNLLSNEWKGDRVIHVGDYAEGNDRTTTQKLIEKIVNENDLKCSVYHWGDTFEEVKPSREKDIRYVYNHTKKEYVDLYKQPIQWSYCNDKEIAFTKFNSFALLTACGNGRGGGDYRSNHINFDFVGYWAGDNIESSDTLLKDYSKYKERSCIFDELDNFKNNIFTTDKKKKQLNVSSAIEMLKMQLKYIRDSETDDISKYKIDDYGLFDYEKESLEESLKQEQILSKNKEKEMTF